MANILEEVANINAPEKKGKDKEISLQELEKHFDDITKDEEYDNEKQIRKLVEAFQKNLKHPKYTFETEEIQREIVRNSKKFSDINENTIKVYQFCQILQGKREIKKDGSEKINIDGNEIPQEMIAERIAVYAKRGLGFFQSEAIKYEDQKLKIHTLFGDVEVPYEASRLVYDIEYDTEDGGLMQNDGGQLGLLANQKKLSNFFSIIDTADDMKKFVTTEKIKIFNAYIAAHPDQKNTPDDLEAVPTDKEQISLSKTGIVEIKIEYPEYDVSVQKTIDIATVTSSDEVLKIIQEQRTACKEIKHNHEVSNEKLDAIIGDEKKIIFDDAEMTVITEWYVANKDSQPNKVKQLQENIQKRVNLVSTGVNNKIGKNLQTDLNKRYEPEDIKMIQFQANICFGENLTIDGNRGNLYYSSKNDQNQKLTNLYIYRQEFKTRKEVIAVRPEAFKDLLDIPNVDDLLSVLGDVNKQNQVFSQFLEFFWDIREAGMGFENEIGDESMQLVLEYMVSAETDTSVDADEYVKKLQALQLDDEDLEKCRKEMIDDITKAKVKNMGEYYRGKVDMLKKEIIAVQNANIEYNNNLAVRDILQDIEQLQKQLDDLDDAPEERIIDTYVPGPTLYHTDLYGKTKATDTSHHQQTVIDGRIHTEWGKIKKQILIKELEIYNINKDEGLLTQICLEIKQAFSESDRATLFNDDFFQEYFLGKETIDTIKAPPHPYTWANETSVETDRSLRAEEVNKIYSKKITAFDAETKNQSRTENGPIDTALYQYESKGNLEIKPLDKSTSIIKSNMYEVSVPGGDSGIDYTIHREGDLPPLVNDQGHKLIVVQTYTNTDPYAAQRQLGVKDVPKPDYGGRYLVSTFGYAYKDTQGNLITTDIRGNGIGRFSPDQQRKAKEEKALVGLDLFDYDMSKIMSDFEMLGKDLGPMNGLLKKYEAGGLFGGSGISKPEVEDLQSFAQTMLNKLPGIEYTSLPKWKKERAELQKMQSANKDLSDDLDQKITQMIAAFDNMINFFDAASGESQASVLFNRMTLTAQNDTYETVFLDRWNNYGLETLLAIAGAVLAIALFPFSFGASVWGLGLAMLAKASLGAVGSMILSRVGRVMNEGIQNTFNPIIINGQKFEYVNETDVELYMQGKIDDKTFRTNLGTELFMSTLMTFGFMLGGSIIGSALAKAGVRINRLKPTAQLARFKDIAKNIVGRGNQLATNASKSFGKSFLKEFGEETFEETMENVGEKIHPALGGVITILNCLNAHGANDMLEKYKISGGQTSIDKGSKSMKTIYTYDQANQNVDGLTKYFTEELKYTPTLIGGKLQFTKPMNEADIVKNKEGKVLLNTEIIEFIPSKAKSFVNNSMGFFAEYGLEINHDTENEIKVTDSAKFELFTYVVKTQGIGNIKTDKNGNMQFITGEETINIKMPSINSGNGIVATDAGKPGLPTEYENVVSNTQLEDGPRLLKAEELLGIKLTPEQQQAILTAHNQDGTIYNLNFTQIKTRVEILSKAGFTSEQVRVLLENGICGKVDVGVVNAVLEGVFDNKDVEMIKDGKLTGENLIKKLQEEFGITSIIDENSGKEITTVREKYVNVAIKLRDIFGIDINLNDLTDRIPDWESDIDEMLADKELAQKIHKIKEMYVGLDINFNDIGSLKRYPKKYESIFNAENIEFYKKIKNTYGDVIVRLRDVSMIADESVIFGEEFVSLIGYAKSMGMDMTSFLTIKQFVDYKISRNDIDFVKKCRDTYGINDDNIFFMKKLSESWNKMDEGKIAILQSLRENFPEKNITYNNVLTIIEGGYDIKRIEVLKKIKDTFGLYVDYELDNGKISTYELNLCMNEQLVDRAKFIQENGYGGGITIKNLIKMYYEGVADLELTFIKNNLDIIKSVEEILGGNILNHPDDPFINLLVRSDLTKEDIEFAKYITDKNTILYYLDDEIKPIKETIKPSKQDYDFIRNLVNSGFDFKDKTIDITQVFARSKQCYFVNIIKTQKGSIEVFNIKYGDVLIVVSNLDINNERKKKLLNEEIFGKDTHLSENKEKIDIIAGMNHNLHGTMIDFVFEKGNSVQTTKNIANQISNIGNLYFDVVFDKLSIEDKQIFINELLKENNKQGISEFIWNSTIFNAPDLLINGTIDENRSESQKRILENMGMVGTVYMENIYKYLELSDKKEFVNILEKNEMDRLKYFVFDSIMEKNPNVFMYNDGPKFQRSEEQKQEIDLANRIGNSPNTQIQAIRAQIMQFVRQMPSLDAKNDVIDKIIGVFEENSLPEVAKLFRVAQIFVGTPEIMKNKIFKVNEESGKPYVWGGYLVNGEWEGNVYKKIYVDAEIKINEIKNNNSLSASEKDREIAGINEQSYKSVNQEIRKTLLVTYINSNNKNLKDYMKFMSEGEMLMKNFDVESGLDGLDVDEQEKLYYWLKKVDALYSNRKSSKISPTSLLDNIQDRSFFDFSKKNLVKIYGDMKRKFRVGEGETILSKLENIFLKPAGFDSHKQVLEYMDKLQSQQIQQTVDMYNNAEIIDGERYIRLETEMYIHGIGGELEGMLPSYIREIFQGGSKPKEFLGQSGKLKGDLTQYDSDTSKITHIPENGALGEKNKMIVMDSLAGEYGSVLLILKPGKDPQGNDKITFPTPARWGNKGSNREFSEHYGWQSIDMNDVVAIMAHNDIINNKGELEKLYVNIIKSGVPKLVVDVAGKVIFGPSEYNALQKKMFLNVDKVYEFNETSNKIEFREATKEENANYELFLQRKDIILKSIRDGDLETTFKNINEIPFFEQYMKGQTGVSADEEENLVLLDHTKNVMESFYKNFPDFKSTNITKEQMGLVVLLHDLGKVYAHDVIGDKNAQHTVTGTMLSKILFEFGIDEKTSNVMLSIIEQPEINHKEIMTYILQNNVDEISAKRIAHDILSVALNNNISPQEYFNLLQIFTICDGGVYNAEDFKASFELNSNGKKIRSENQQKKMDLIGGYVTDKVTTLQQKGYLITENDMELIEKCDITTLPLLKGIPFELVSKAQKDNLNQKMALEEIMPEITPEIKTQYEAYVKQLEDANKNPDKVKAIMEANPDMMELQKSLINRMFVMGEENLESFREITNNLAILSGGRKPEGVAKFEMKENTEGKNMDRLITKTNMENDGDISGLSDILRTTIVFDTLEGMNAGIAKMLASEYFQQGKVSIKNRINAPFACDMIIKFEMPTGFVAEIQLHTPESYKAKHEGMEVDTEHIDMGNGTFESITEADRDLIETLISEGKIDKKSILPENNQKVSTTYLYDIRRDMAPYAESNTKIADLYNKLGKLEIQINKHYMAEYEKTKGSFSY